MSNLAVMGDSFPQYLARLRNLALPLRPRVVLVFAFGGNDLSDIIQVRTERMQREFIDRGTALEAQIVPRETLLSGPRPGSRSIASAIEHHALVYRTLRFLLLKSARQEVPPHPPADVSDHAPSPIAAPPTDLTPPERLGLSYLEAALVMMRDSARGVGTELVVVYLPGLSQPGAREDRLVFHHTQAFAKKLGLHFVDASPVQYQDGRPVRGARLDYDHHLSEAGHRRLAALLADYIERNALLEPRRSR